MYKSAMKWTKRTDQLIHKYQIQDVKHSIQETESSAQNDVSGELRQLKKFEKDGVITSEEFEMKKKQLLGL